MTTGENGKLYQTAFILEVLETGSGNSVTAIAQLRAE